MAGVLALAVGLGAPAWAADGGDPVLEAAAVESPASAVVLIRQGSTMCAGAFVDAEGHIATSYHCISDGARARVETADGRRVTARVESRLASLDLAVLHAPELAGEPYLTLRDEPPVPGMVVRAHGHPLGSLRPEGFFTGTLRWSVSEGVVAAVGPRALQVTAPVNPGNSGGPLLDEEGRMVGVVSRRLRGDGLGFASRVEPLARLLAEPRRGSILGGSVRAGLRGSLFNADGGTASGGVVVDVSLRDRVVVGASLSFAPQPNFDALRYGQASWSAAEGRVGLRARAGSGYWTSRADLYAGVAAVQTVRRTGPAESFRTSPELRVAPLFGGRVSLATIALDVGFIPLSDEDGDPFLATRTSLMLLWPGRIGVL